MKTMLNIVFIAAVLLVMATATFAVTEADTPVLPPGSFMKEFILADKSTKIPDGVKHYGPSYVPLANEFAWFLDYTGQGYGFIFDGDWCKDRSYTIADVLSGHAMQPAQLFIQKEVDSLWKAVGFTSSGSKFTANPASDDYISKQEMISMIEYALFKLERPVIIPLESHWWGSIVIGYKDNGDTLVIYHYLPYFMDMENNAQPKIEEISDWYNDKTTIFISDFREKVLSFEEIYLKGFNQIQASLEANVRDEKQYFYIAWEAFLRMNTDRMIAEVKRSKTVPGGEIILLPEGLSDEGVWKFICEAHNNTWCDMAERRFYVMQFFIQAVEYYPEFAADLKELADHFGYASGIMSDGYNIEVGDPVNPEIFKNPDVRNRMADCVKRFREADEKGLEMVEKLLTRLKVD